MLGTIFYCVLNMSIAACIVIAVLLVVRRIKPLPKRVIYPLWALALIRLAIPFSPPTGWSLFNYAGTLVKRVVSLDAIAQIQTQAQTQPPGNLVMMNFIGAAEQYAPVAYKTEALSRVFASASAIWAIVTISMLMTAIVLHALTRKELAKAASAGNNVYRTDMLLSPVVTGLIRPRIILPAALCEGSAEYRMILAHEHVHIRRRDNLWRGVGIAIACFHWFNPMSWIMLRAFFMDMELSCDEAVIRDYAPEERKAYAGTLLRYAEDKRQLVSSAFGRSGVKLRITGVLNYRKLSIIGAAASSLLLLIIAIALLTNPRA